MSRPLPFRLARTAARQPGANKYKAQAVVAFDRDGKPIRIQSKREAKRWAELVLLERQGVISQLERQVTFTFSAADFKRTRGMVPQVDDEQDLLRHLSSNRRTRYVLDFRYVQDGELVHEDTKGVRTPEYKVKQALMEFFHGIEVLEV